MRVTAIQKNSFLNQNFIDIDFRRILLVKKGLIINFSINFTFIIFCLNIIIFLSAPFCKIKKKIRIKKIHQKDYSPDTHIKPTALGH